MLSDDDVIPVRIAYRMQACQKYFSLDVKATTLTGLVKLTARRARCQMIRATRRARFEPCHGMHYIALRTEDHWHVVPLECGANLGFV